MLGINNISVYVCNKSTVFSPWPLWELLMLNCSLQVTGHIVKAGMVEVGRKNSLTKSLMKACFLTLASDLTVVLQWVLLAQGSKEMETWLTCLGRQDFMGKEKQHDQNGFPGKWKVRQAGENYLLITAILEWDLRIPNLWFLCF